MRAFRRSGSGIHVFGRPARRGFAFGASTAAVLGVAVGAPVTLGGQVSAAAHTPVIITGFAAAPADGPTITYGDTTVRVSGRLVDYRSQGTGVPGERVQVEFGTNTPVGTATTGADGSFSATVPLPRGGTVWAEFNGDATYGYARTNTVAIDAVQAPTRVTINPPPRLVPAGTRLTVTGKAEVKVAGAWEPLPGALVELDRDSRYPTLISEATTGADGKFGLPATVTAAAEWQAIVHAQAAEPFSLYGSSDSNAVGVGAAYRTRIAAVSLPARREAHQPFEVTGAAQVWNGARWTGYAGMWVRYYYRVLGTSRWVYAGDAQTNAAGEFTSGASVRPGHLLWQVRVPAYSDADKFLPSASGTHTSFITDHTCVTGLAVNHVDGRTVVHARVRDWCANGQVTFGEVKGKIARVYYHPRGTRRWRLLGQLRTDANGFVVFTKYSVVRGYFTVVFPAQGYYLASASRARYAG